MTRRVVVAALVLGGCAGQPPSSKPADDSELRARVVDLEKRLKTTQAQVLALKRQVPPYKTALLDPERPSEYSRLDTSAGTLLVAVGGVSREGADTARVVLKVGNPSSITFKGFGLRARWGEKLASGTQEEWAESLREGAFRFEESLRPGAWTTLVLVLKPAPTNLGYLEVEIDPDDLVLRE